MTPLSQSAEITAEKTSRVVVSAVREGFLAWTDEYRPFMSSALTPAGSAAADNAAIYAALMSYMLDAARTG